MPLVTDPRVMLPFDVPQLASVTFVDSLLGKLNEAIECYHDGESWEQIVSAGMNRDFTWKNSAEEYDQLYRQLLEK